MAFKKEISVLIIWLMLLFGFQLVNARESAKNPDQRKRARDLGIIVGILPTGKFNTITDVPGVLVGHYTKIKGADIRTGITAILPHDSNLFQNKVPAAIHLANGFGKLTGYSQVEELGNLETPILLTSTLNVPEVADGLISYTLGLPGNEEVRSVNPVVGETNDGWLSNIRQRPLGEKEVLKAIRSAASGPVAEGSIGAGTGTVCFGFKGGIGTSSRLMPAIKGSYTVGVLVQTNFGGILQINGAPVGRELRQFYSLKKPKAADGSCMIVVATDAPLSSRNLKRLAKRAIFGMARTGSVMSNGSGDYVIAFSTNTSGKRLQNQHMTPLFLAVIEATEEAIYNSLFMATSVTGHNGHSATAIPLDQVKKICKKYNVLNWDKKLPVAAPKQNK